MFRVNIKPENLISTWNMKVYLDFLPILAWAWSRSFDIFSSWVLSLFVSLVFELIIFFIWFISSRSLSISRFESSKWEVIESSSASCACKAEKKIYRCWNILRFIEISTPDQRMAKLKTFPNSHGQSPSRKKSNRRMASPNSISNWPWPQFRINPDSI